MNGETWEQMKLELQLKLLAMGKVEPVGQISTIVTIDLNFISKDLFQPLHALFD